MIEDIRLIRKLIEMAMVRICLADRELC